MLESKDWIGNKKSTFVTLGASNHSDDDREQHDYYATDPICAIDLLNLGLGINNIWEPSCGEGHLAKVFNTMGVLTKASDLIDRGYGEKMDFLTSDYKHDGWIVTNPPFKYAKEFCEKALSITPTFAMFLKITFLEASSRYELFKNHPPKYVYVYSSRRKCAINGDFNAIGSSAACYAWFIWDGEVNETTLRWIK